MSNIFDVAQFVTELEPGVDKMRLYKLCYFAHGWNLAWTGRPLVGEDFSAWAMGPVPAELRARTEAVASGWTVPYVPTGDSSRLSVAERGVIRSVVSFYREFTSQQLSAMSHGSAWSEARCGIPEGARSTNALSTSTIREEFTARLHAGASVPIPPADVTGAAALDRRALERMARETEAEWRETLNVLAAR